MDHAVMTLNQVLPILLLIVLGNQLRKRAWLAESSIDDLKWLTINIALPSVLFLSFLNLKLQVSYLAIMGVIFMLCVVMYGAGELARRIFAIDHPYFPMLVTGFEFGMLGVSLFGSAYGLDKIGYIAVIGLGHEFFIWFPFLSLLLIKRDGIRNISKLTTAFVKAPPILAIMAGVTLNLLGMAENLFAWPVTGGLLTAMEFTGQMTIPLILIIVGYGFKLETHGIRDVLITVAFRMLCLIPLALLLNTFFLRDMLHLPGVRSRALHHAHSATAVHRPALHETRRPR